MKFSKLFKFLTFFTLVVVLISPRPTYAASTDISIFSSPDSFFVKIQETIESFLAFKVENKVSVLERHAEKRLIAAQGYAEEGNKEKVQNMLKDYQQIKERQNNLLGKIDDGKVLGMVAERTVEQQKIMEEIKTKTNKDIKQEVIQVQEQVVNQVAKRVVDVNGPEGATEFLNEAAHVWAPGTGPGGGEAGVVFEGGGKLIYAPGTGPGGPGGVVIEGGEMRFAPGTSEGGPSGADIKNVEVKTGGSVENGLPPGVTSGGGGKAVDSLAPGTTNTSEGGSRDFAPGTTSGGETGIAP